MSWAQRFLPLAVASSIGIISGVYIFDPIVRQYTVDAGLAPEHRALLRPNPDDAAEGAQQSGGKSGGELQREMNAAIPRELGQDTNGQQQQQKVV